MCIRDRTIVSPSGVAGLNFADEADTVNALIPQLRARGIRLSLIHISEPTRPY